MNNRLNTMRSGINGLKTMRHLLALVLTVLFVLPAEARQDAALPDLAPREVEITGDLTIAFPALRRQPIVGFNPPPRVPDIPSGRTPFTEAYAQRSADLPPSPLQPPEPPQVSAIERRVAAEGLIDVRLGAFLDRSVTADVTLLESEKTTALFDLDYFGTDGHDVVMGGSGLKTGRDVFKTSVGLEQRLGPVVWGIGGSGHRSSYGLFGAVPAPGSPALPNPTRVVSGFDGDLTLASRSGARNRFKIQTKAGLSQIDSDLFDPAVRLDPATDREAGFLEVDLMSAFPIRDGEIRLQASGNSMGLDASGFPGSTVRSGFSSAEISWDYSSRLSILAGAALLGFDSETQTGVDPTRTLSYVAPIAGLEYLVSESVSLTVVARPEMTSGLLGSVMEESPVVMDEPIVLPSIATMDANVAVQVQSEMLTASIGGGWRDQPFRRIAYDPVAGARGYATGYPQLDYRSTDVLYSNLDVSVIPFRGLQIGVDVLWQKATIAATSEQAPYTSPLVIGGFASIGLLDGDLESRVEVLHESSRSSDLLNTLDVPAFTTANVMVSWFFHQNYGITTGVRDLGSNPQFWRGYTFESSAFFVGFRYRW